MFQVRKLSEQEKEAILYYGCFALDVIQPYFSNIDKEEIKSVLDIIRQKIIGITHYSTKEAPQLKVNFLSPLRRVFSPQNAHGQPESNAI